jgi:dephospho-CoA kinase
MEVNTFLLNLMAQAPAAAAVIVVVVYFLRHLRAERETRTKVYTTRHREFFAELERGREMCRELADVVKDNTKQAAKTQLVLEQTTEILRKLNGHVVDHSTRSDT